MSKVESTKNRVSVLSPPSLYKHTCTTIALPQNDVPAVKEKDKTICRVRHLRQGGATASETGVSLIV